jgi:hypothetical protein
MSLEFSVEVECSDVPSVITGASAIPGRAMLRTWIVFPETTLCDRRVSVSDSHRPEDVEFRRKRLMSREKRSDRFWHAMRRHCSPV